MFLSLITLTIAWINSFTNFTNNNWYLKIALPIVLINYLFLNILVCVKFLKINKLLKTSIVLFLISMFTYLPPMFIKSKNTFIQSELIDDTNILKANFSVWKEAVSLENNIHCIIFLILISLSIVFCISGLLRYFKNKKIQ